MSLCGGNGPRCEILTDFTPAALILDSQISVCLLSLVFSPDHASGMIRLKRLGTHSWKGYSSHFILG